MTIRYANLIPLLETGYEHSRRMNAKRVGKTISREEFLSEISARIGGHRARNDWQTPAGAEKVQRYLSQRLTPGRLALPEGYDLGDR